MTLRIKMAVALGALAAAATLMAAGVSYAATSDRLASAVDSYLEQAAAQLARGGGPPPIGSGRALGTPVGTGALVPAPPPPGRSANVANLLDILLVQELGPHGAVVFDSAQVRLPVTQTDLNMAENGGSPVLHTEYVGTTPYRVITVPRPAGGAIQLAQNQSETIESLHSLRSRLALLALAVTAISAAVGWLIARRIASPLGRLAAAAEEVVDREELRVPLEVARKDEVGRLARSMTAMVDDLAESRKQQHRLVQDAGHELRTPLTSVKTNIGLLKRHPDLPEAVRDRVLSDLDSEVEELSALVNEVVDLATDGHREEPEAEVRLDLVAARVVERMGARTGRSVSLDADPVIVRGRERALERAISNLVDNADKFSPDGSAIRVVVQADRVEVHDQGPGIAEVDMERIFERFYRSDQARSQPGSGLGLSIVRQVVEDHGGRVFVRSGVEGGSVVGFELSGGTRKIGRS